jgi:hypothetical protein
MEPFNIPTAMASALFLHPTKPVPEHAFDKTHSHIHSRFCRFAEFRTTKKKHFECPDAKSICGNVLDEL